jgi:hypothetical protein
VGDITLMVFGVLAAVYTTVQTIMVGFRHRQVHPSNYSSYFTLQLMFEPKAGGPTFGHC